jgi:hypothetical protein
MSTSSKNARGATDAFPAIIPGSSQYVTVAGSSDSSTELDCTIVRLVTDTDCFVKIAQGSATASSNDMFMLANTVEYFGCSPGDVVAVIQSSSGGTLYITEGA